MVGELAENQAQGEGLEEMEREDKMCQIIDHSYQFLDWNKCGPSRKLFRYLPLWSSNVGRLRSR